MTGTNGNTATVELIPQPKRLGVGQTADGLIEIEIQLRKFHLWVSEANAFTRFRLNALITEVANEFGEFEKLNEQERWKYNLLIHIWAPLFVCTRGDEVPAKDQFLSIPSVDQALWIETARELGHVFAWLDGLNRVYEVGLQNLESEEETVKKKSGKRQDHSGLDEVAAEQPGTP